MDREINSTQLPEPQGLVSKYFIGESLPHKWASVYNYRASDELIFAQKGEVYAVFKLISPEGFNSATAGNLLVDYFHECYFESKKESVIEALDAAIHKTQERLAQLISNAEGEGVAGVDLDITAIVVRGTEIYFANAGEGKILLLTDRDSSTVIDVSDAIRDPFGKGLIKVGSSFIQPDHRFLLATAGFTDEVPEMEIVSSLCSLSDLRFKNFEYKHPENIALFMIAYQPELSETNYQNLNTEDAAPNSEVEEQDVLDQDYVEPELHVADLPPAEVQDPSIWLKEKGKILIEFAQTLPERGRRMINKVRKSRELQRLQNFREKAVSEGEGESGVTHSLRSRFLDNQPVITGDMNTFQVILLKIRSRAINVKDWLLYDVLQVNNFDVKNITQNRAAMRTLTFAGVIILLIIGYFVISSIGAERERLNQIDIAKEALNVLVAKIDDDISNDPVLNISSRPNITERQGVISEIDSVTTELQSAKFSVLDQAEIQTQLAKLVGLRKQAQRMIDINPQVLTDVGNFFEGTADDIEVIGNNLYILDSTKGAIYRQPISGGNAVLVTDGLASPKSLTADANGELIVYSEASPSIQLVNPASGKKNPISGISPANLANISQISLYDTTNAVYAAGKISGDIQVMNRSGNSYTLPVLRFSGDEITSISDVEIIQGRIVMLTTDEGFFTVKTNNQTSEITNAFPDMLENLKSAPGFSFDAKNLYVVDSLGKRLIVFSLSLEADQISYDYSAQVDLSTVDGSLKEVVVTDNLVIIAAGSKIYSLNKTTLR